MTTKPLKILQISTTDFGGGAEGSAWKLFQAYRERGHQSWLAVGRKLSDDPDVIEIPRLRPEISYAQCCLRLYERLTGLEGKVPGMKRVRGILRALSGGWPEIERRLGHEDFHYPGSRQFLRLLPAQPDIIHAHNLHGKYFDLRYLVPLSREFPVILNLRDMWLLTGHCAYPVKCERWKTGCGNCPDLKIYPKIQRDATAFNWRRKRRIYAHGRFYVTVISEWLMRQVEQSMLHGIEERIIRNAIDLQIFTEGDRRNARMQLGLPLDANIVMLTAQTAFKDVAMMEAVLCQLHCPSAKMIFLCLGKLAETRSVGMGTMMSLGFERDPKRMALYYRAADVFIHAAKAEAFGKTIAEAMACGTPVVATAVGGIPELIDDGETGYLVPQGDITSMAARIHALLENPILRRQMGTRAISIAQRRFHLERQVQEFLDWYQDIRERDCASFY